MTTYQPTATSGGERPCTDRWEPVRAVLGRLPQPFTVWDVGAAQGWFTRAIVDEFPHAHVTAMDPGPGLGDLETHPQVTVIRGRVTAVDLHRLPRPDVVLALSVLHHFPDWPLVLTLLRACHQFALIETPAPEETWMRRAAARRELPGLVSAVKAQATSTLGRFERRGRDGHIYLRPLFLLPSNMRTLTGAVFTGNGVNHRKLTPELHGAGLDTVLGYQPHPGSLNLRLSERKQFLGDPPVVWPGTVNGRDRPYWFWPAWIRPAWIRQAYELLPVHVLNPAGRGQTPYTVEVVAPVRLRDWFNLADGDRFTVQVACGGT